MEGQRKMGSQPPKLREPGRRVFPPPKPKLALIKPTQEHKPTPDFPPEVKEMLREMRQRQRGRERPEPPDAA